MVSVGIVGNADKQTIMEIIHFLKTITDFQLIYVKQSDEKLYIVTDKVFNAINKEGNNDFNNR